MLRSFGAARSSTLLALSLLLIVPGCAKKSPVAPAGPGAVQVAVNGARSSSAPGVVSLNVSVLAGGGALVRNATLSDPVLSGLVVSGPAGASASRASSVTSGSAYVFAPLVDRGSITAAIALDASGSMALTDPDNLRLAAAEVFIARMNATDNAAVASFVTGTPPSAGCRAIRIWGGGTNHDSLDAYAVRACYVRPSDAVVGNTPLWDAMFDSEDLDTTMAGANRVALILTDGVNNTSMNTTLRLVIDNARLRNVQLFVIGLANGALGGLDAGGETSMKAVADSTGGFYARTDDAAGLVQLFDNVFNAAQASGTIAATFLVDGKAPPAGTVISGTLTLKVNGTPVESPFRVVL